MIKALIIDDEKHCCDNLQWQLNKYCPEIEIASVCNNAATGLKQIELEQPQLIFLDVEMPGMSGFDMLATFSEINFDLIFTTAFDQYAIRAIKFGALDYLVKPIDKDELRASVDAFLKRSHHHPTGQLKALLSHLQKNNDLTFRKIAFPTLHGYELIPITDIVQCESNSNYTNIRLQNGKTLLVSKTLKEIAEILDLPEFFRIHNSFLVNLQYAVRYIKGEGGFLVLSNEQTIPVSRNKKEELLKIITHLSP